MNNLAPIDIAPGVTGNVNLLANSTVTTSQLSSATVSNYSSLTVSITLGDQEAVLTPNSQVNLPINNNILSYSVQNNLDSNTSVLQSSVFPDAKLLITIYTVLDNYNYSNVNSVVNNNNTLYAYSPIIDSDTTIDIPILNFIGIVTISYPKIFNSNINGITYNPIVNILPQVYPSNTTFVCPPPRPTEFNYLLSSLQIAIIPGLTVPINAEYLSLNVGFEAFAGNPPGGVNFNGYAKFQVSYSNNYSPTNMPTYQCQESLSAANTNYILALTDFIIGAKYQACCLYINKIVVDYAGNTGSPATTPLLVSPTGFTFNYNLMPDYAINQTGSYSFSNIFATPNTFSFYSTDEFTDFKIFGNIIPIFVL